ncbi:hypothetical protein MKK64_09590 [Methylobacterium sp. E-025]|uniref:hypothetical protein n=1 Tax=Methylobacterium sp. E-025 TaxID=2836561 RepID=UPI001FB9E587|nr:hypothetical protein [Methylobacterium sp. E-025]MCJ2111444.1 hypothetical protein [Methylobacterium sp. E-025]
MGDAARKMDPSHETEVTRIAARSMSPPRETELQEVPFDTARVGRPVGGLLLNRQML